MRPAYLFTTLLLIAAAHAQTPAAGTTIVDDTFDNGNSQLQDIPNNSLWLFNGRAGTVRTDAKGSVTFDITKAGGSEAFWAFFTPSGKPLDLGVGDTLSVSVTFSLSGFQNNGQDIRWGVLNSLGTRNSGNLTGGMNDGSFAGDTGYGLDFFASGTGNPFVIGRRTTLSSANVFNSFGDFTPIPGTGAAARQALQDNVPYTLTYTVQRLSATSTQISTSVTGGNLSGLNYTSIETSPTPNTAFDYFAYRVTGTGFATGFQFTELMVRFIPAAPQITAQPQPSSLTVQVGGNVTLAVGASGNAVTYQWQKDGQPIDANPSASTPTLKLTSVQHGDAGTYTVLVSNAGGAVLSAPVALSISDMPVPPLPSISSQPINTTVTVGNPAVLSVGVNAPGLFFVQWFKNGVLIPDATMPRLSFVSAQVSDAAVYTAVVSNSSGSTITAPATLQVVSGMSAKVLSPAAGTSGLCADSPLSIQFDQAPQVGKTGRVQVFDAKGNVIDSIDMTASLQTKTIGGSGFVYFPVMVSGNTASIYLHQPLPFGGTYSVTVDPGVVTDANGAPFAGIADNKTWTFSTRAAGPVAGSTALKVAADGTGDFCAVQSAIDFVPANNTTPVVITVQPGTYTEINYVPSNKPFITVRGADRSTTIIQYPNNATVNSGNQRAQFGVDASDFTLENISLHNTTPHGGSQAESFRGNNQRIVLNRVNLASFQDTLMLQGGGFVTDSYIEGDVDFMWGNGAVYFQNDELKAVTSGGYYAQIRNGQNGNGNVYVNCKLTSAPGVTGSYLARIDPTVFPYSQVVYINTMMGPHINPVGWLLNNSNSAPNVQFWEYGSTDLNGVPIDTGKRLNVSRQLSDADAPKWSDPATVLGWSPYTVNATTSSAAAGQAITVDWSAAVNHSAKDWVGLYFAGSTDNNQLAYFYTGTANTGRMTFYAPASGQYEFRMFQNGGYTRVAVSNAVTVK